jgi:hypothetical protein
MISIIVSSKINEQNEEVVKQFDVYEGLLKAHSPYFSRLCEGTDEEGPKHLKYTGETPAVFNHFMQWLNTGRFDYDERMHNTSRAGRFYIPLIDTWLLARRIEVPKFADVVVEKIFSEFRNLGNAATALPSPETIDYLYNSTVASQEERQLRKPFVYLYAFYAQPNFYKCKALRVCTEFVADVAQRLAELRFTKKAKITAPAPADFTFKFIKPERAVQAQAITIPDSDDEDDEGDDVVIVKARPCKGNNFSTLFFPR